MYFSKRPTQPKLFLFLAMGLLSFSSCSNFVELGAPPTQVGVKEAFQNDESAISAVTGLYNNSYVSNLILRYTVVPGSSADDIHYSSFSLDMDQFSNNAVLPNNSTNTNILWGNTYSEIHQINLAIEGLTAPNSLTPSVKNQLLGEAKTYRAFMYFYLVNFYGDVPLQLSTNIPENALMPRTEAAKVWEQIIADLNDAKNLLSPTYPAAQRARINKYVAKSLLAKAYLYTKDWANAAKEANDVIESGVYSLNEDLNAVFSNNSNGIIWQVATSTGISVFGSNFLAPEGTLPNYVMYDTLYHSFEPNDLRKTHWTQIDTISGQPYYYVYKYKQPSGSGNEYNVVFRLAEQYLIRAEARAQQNDISGAVEDINTIRHRANLPDLPNNPSKADLLLAIEQERKVELFGEWGNRWFDLKRWPSITSPATHRRADDILSGIKPDWSHLDISYPIPIEQLNANKNLTQNEGY